MREILFRAKRIENSEWVYGSVLQSEIDINELDVHCFICERFANEAQLSKVPVIPETVVQFTGRRDADGNNIYEGDYFMDLDENDGSYYVVFYCNINCAFRFHYYSYAVTTNENGGEEYSSELDVVDILDFNDFNWLETTIDGNIHDKNTTS